MKSKALLPVVMLLTLLSLVIFSRVHTFSADTGDNRDVSATNQARVTSKRVVTPTQSISTNDKGDSTPSSTAMSVPKPEDLEAKAEFQRKRWAARAVKIQYSRALDTLKLDPRVRKALESKLAERSMILFDAYDLVRPDKTKSDVNGPLLNAASAPELKRVDDSIQAEFGPEIAAKVDNFIRLSNGLREVELEVRPQLDAAHLQLSDEQVIALAEVLNDRLGHLNPKRNIKDSSGTSITDRALTAASAVLTVDQVETLRAHINAQK